MPIIREYAPAKINLTLEVIGKRPDGYHELESLVAFADVADVVTLDTSKSLDVTTSGPFAHSIAGANLIDATLKLLRDIDEGLTLGAVHLEKNLPVAAGIGGGSADAAAVLRAVQRANPQAAGVVDWYWICTRLGADVPVCLVSRLTWMLGRGDFVSPIRLDTPIAIPALIANPLVPVPPDKTAQVFGSINAAQLSLADCEPAKRKHMENGPCDRHRLDAIIATGENGLQIAACMIVPQVAQVLAELNALPECKIVRMSGGGPTCFAIFESERASHAAAGILRQRRPEWWVAATTLS